MVSHYFISFSWLEKHAQTNFSGSLSFIRIKSQSDCSPRIPSHLISCLLEARAKIIGHPEELVWNLLMCVFIFFFKIHIYIWFIVAFMYYIYKKKETSLEYADQGT